MNLYEFEGKRFFQKHGIAVPRGVVVRRGEDAAAAYWSLEISDVVVKAQVLSGKRGKNGAIRFCSNVDDVQNACGEIFASSVRGQYVAAIRIEEKLDIAEEHYLSISYDTGAKQPMLVYSRHGGVDIEAVDEERIKKYELRIMNEAIHVDVPCAQKLWECFVQEDCRVAEINPLVKTIDGQWIAADAKVAIDDDAFYRHEEWKELEPRTIMGRLPTDREIAVAAVDSGEKYYQGTAGKYIEMDGDIATLFIGGGASIANMDAMMHFGLMPANYTEYSGNPPREKVYELTKIVLSKPGLRGLWIAGVVSNFTNVKETFMGTADALAEIMPTYPIVVRRDGPFGQEGKEYFMNFAKEKGLNVMWFGKDVSMSETAKVLAEMVRSSQPIANRS